MTTTPDIEAVKYADLTGTSEELTLRSDFGRILKHHEILNGVLLADLVSNALATITALQARVDEAEGRLFNLLAVIHRDGGQAIDRLGVHQAWEDAMQLSSDRIGADDDLKASQAEVAGLRDYIVECYEHAANEVTTLRADLAAHKAAVAEAVRRAANYDTSNVVAVIAPLLALAEPAKQPEGDALVGPYAGEVWTYKGKDYCVLDVGEDYLIQFQDEWYPTVEYRCEPDTGKTFYRALPDFLAKFTRGLSVGEGRPYEPFWDNPDGPGAA